MWYSNCFGIWLGDGTNVTTKKLNKFKNNVVFQNEFMRNVTDALHRYKIANVPETCSERIILQSLLYFGFTFFFEKQGNLMCLPGMPDGSGINVYADFGGAYVYGANGYNERISLFIPGSDKSSFLKKTINGNSGSQSGGVMVRENPLLYPFINQVIYYSERQSDTLRKIETAQKNAATPYIITAEASIVNTVKEFMNRRDNNEEYIVSSGIFPADKINLLPFDIQADSIKVMTETYDWYCNHFRELCGVKNTTNIDKKGENLISDEVNINEQYTNNQLDKTIKYINEGLDLVNEMYGTEMQAEAVGTMQEEGEEENADISGISDEASGSVQDTDA